MSARLTMGVAVLLAYAAAARETAASDRVRRPGRFAIIFNMGYAGDRLPEDPKSFERCIRAVKQAHFNTVL